MKTRRILLAVMAMLLPLTVMAQTYTINGISYPIPDAVDLGLPSGNKWANMNIGASSVNEEGGYYGWADPTGELTIDDYYWRGVEFDGPWTSPLFGGTNPPHDISGTESDIATSKLGSDWCMPSTDDFKEIYDNCTFAGDGKGNVKVTGPNGNSIILPITGIWFFINGGITKRNSDGTETIIEYPSNFNKSMNIYSCFWTSTNSFVEYGSYYGPYAPYADFVTINEEGFVCALDFWGTGARNQMIPIRAIKRGNGNQGQHNQGQQQTGNQCSSPTISIKNGEITFACETDGVTYHYDIKSLDDKTGEGNSIKLTNTYRVSVYASKEGFTDSDVATKDIQMQLCDANGDGVLNAADIVTIVNMIMSSK